MKAFHIQVSKSILWFLFSCNNFGRKAIECRAQLRNDYIGNMSRGSYKILRNAHVRNNCRSFDENVVKSYKLFSLVLDHVE